MSLVRGENVLGFIYDGGQWKPIVCGRNISYTSTSEAIETSITGSGVWRTYEYAGNTAQATFDGLTMLQQVNTIALPDLRALQATQTKILFRYQRTDDSSNVYLEEMTCLIRSISDNGEYNSINSFSVDLLVTGPPTIIFTPTPINPSGKVKRLEYTGISGEYYFTNALLNLVDVIDVVVDGVGRSKIITSGTPVSQEAKYTSSGGLGRIEIAQPLDTGIEVYVLYQDL